MNLDKFIEQLLSLQAEGHGHLEVYSEHGASGEIDPLSTPFVRTGDPDYFDEEIEYISVYSGN